MPNSTYLSLEEAARRHHVKEKVLTQLIADSMLRYLYVTSSAMARDLVRYYISGSVTSTPLCTLSGCSAKSANTLGASHRLNSVATRG